MDYEKKYKEAKGMAEEIIRYYKEHNRGDETSIEDLEQIFPELTESKDEKIRKWLIDWAKAVNWSEQFTITKEQVLAWLEKQVDCSAKWHKNTPENKPPKNHSVLMKTVDGIAEGEWDGKYWYQYRWSTHIYDSNVLYWIELHDLDAQGVQKPTSDIKYKVSVDGSLSIVNDKPFDYEKATITQNDFASVGETATIELSSPIDCGDRIYHVSHKPIEKNGEQKHINDTDEEIVNAVKDTSVLDMVEPKFKVKYAGNEYNVFEIRNINGIKYYGIEDEPNHIDYIKADSCKKVDGYSIKENGSPYPINPETFAGQKPTWSEEDEEMTKELIEGFLSSVSPYRLTHTSKEIVDWLDSVKCRMKGKED